MDLRLINILLLTKRFLRKKRNVDVSIVVQYFRRMKFMNGVKTLQIGLLFASIVELIHLLESQ